MAWLTFFLVECLILLILDCCCRFFVSKGEKEGAKAIVGSSLFLRGHSSSRLWLVWIYLNGWLPSTTRCLEI